MAFHAANVACAGLLFSDLKLEKSINSLCSYLTFRHEPSNSAK